MVSTFRRVFVFGMFGMVLQLLGELTPLAGWSKVLIAIVVAGLLSWMFLSSVTISD